jgi:hypothetical protein
MLHHPEDPAKLVQVGEVRKTFPGEITDIVSSALIGLRGPVSVDRTRPAAGAPSMSGSQTISSRWALIRPLQSAIYEFDAALGHRSGAHGRYPAGALRIPGTVDNVWRTDAWGETRVDETGPSPRSSSRSLRRWICEAGQGGRCRARRHLAPAAGIMRITDSLHSSCDAHAPRKAASTASFSFDIVLEDGVDWLRSAG